MMLAEISTDNTQNPKPSSPQDQQRQRPPLLPSEKDNGTTTTTISRRPKSRRVSSRYMSSSPSTSSSSSISTSSTPASTLSRRYPSPLVSKGTNLANLPTPTSTQLPGGPRAQSVGRRRPATARPTTPLPESRIGNVGGEISAATKLLVTSTRSLSVSFQGEAFSLPISKAKEAPASPNLSNVRKGTPERRRGVTPLRGKSDGGTGDLVENSKPGDQHRWPGRSRQVNPLPRSFDCTAEKRNVVGSGNMSGRSLQHSMIDDSRRASFDGRLSLDLSSAELLKAIQVAQDANSVNESSVPSDLSASDTDSVSSGSTSGMQEGGGVISGRSGPRGIIVSARFWQETSNRLRHLQDPGSPLSSSPVSKLIVPPKLGQSKRFPNDIPSLSLRTMSSPSRAAARPASPSKLWSSSTSSPMRGSASPVRMRNLVSGSLSSTSSTPSFLSFAFNFGRGKTRDKCVVDAHILRLLHNRHLQWRFVNARADAALLLQRLGAEKNLWNAWIAISKLRDSVTSKIVKLQLLRRRSRLNSILRGQMSCLEEWAALDREYSASLQNATEALKASTLRLPAIGGAVGDIQSVKDAVCSAVDIMQAMASSICSILTKVEEVNNLLTELANVTAKEGALLEQCKDLLSMTASMQVKDCSLRTHILQLNRVPTSLTTHV
ncbi:QWRF family [Dillenia turbinata]|uniref:QWRF family n=1 Tax=Dillenia turbinata TaxID=194707 RepID=A0AAN8ZQL8_9MAGN